MRQVTGHDRRTPAFHSFLVQHTMASGSFLVQHTMASGSDIPSILPAMQGEGTKPRKGCRYSQAERDVLSRHKEEYKSKATPEEREQVLKQKVFVDIFNHWYTTEGTMPSEAESKERVSV